jgi:hypothetical protein
MTFWVMLHLLVAKAPKAWQPRSSGHHRHALPFHQLGLDTHDSQSSMSLQSEFAVKGVSNDDTSKNNGNIWKEREV